VERYGRRIAQVVPGDTLVFLVAGQYRSIHKVESVPFIDHLPLWPAMDGDYFPHRIKISDPLYVGGVDAAGLANRISFMEGKVWGGTIQGASGVFNPRLTLKDLELIKSHMKAVQWRPGIPTPAEAKITSERQLALFKFYEADIEENVSNSLNTLGLKLYVDPATGRSGRQYVIDGGRIDLLCEDIATGDYVILELKKGQAPEQTLLQILRYMSWIRQNLAGNKDVKGIILTESADSVLPQVVIEVPNVSIRYYRVNVNILPAGAQPYSRPSGRLSGQGRLLQ